MTYSTILKEINYLKGRASLSPNDLKNRNTRRGLRAGMHIKCNITRFRNPIFVVFAEILRLIENCGQYPPAFTG